MDEPKLSEQQVEIISEQLGDPILSHQYFTGGAANHIFRISTSQRGSFIAKICKVNRPNLFKYEADALNHLARTQTVHVPKVIHFSSEYLLMEDLGTEFKEVSAAAWRVFGAQFGSLHPIPVVNRVKSENDGAVQIAGAVYRVDEELFDLPFGFGVAALQPEMPAHEGERDTVQQLFRHGPMAGIEGGNMDVTVEDHYSLSTISIYR